MGWCAAHPSILDNYDSSEKNPFWDLRNGVWSCKARTETVDFIVFCKPLARELKLPVYCLCKEIKQVMGQWVPGLTRDSEFKSLEP